MTHFFQFEADFVDSLRCIPMQVRFKLDTCGVKLKLSHWNPLTSTERQALVDTPCTAASARHYRSLIHRLVQAHALELPADLPIDRQPAWMDETGIPESVIEKAEGAIALAQWASLTPLQRFALIKLSRSQHENKNFLPALQEFGLLQTDRPIGEER
ncbi:MAG: nitrate reductase maturation protein NarM [Leptolyngbyaceae cyanobacterium CSU_1_4]|nr:nitrate reductase maturation protein NarM [Leptolyngbyaceae cyanobacterium CSU_1_4]